MSNPLRRQSSPFAYLFLSHPTFFDTHCHAHFSAYKDDADVVIQETLDVGTWMILVGTQSTTSANAVMAAQRFPEGVFAAVGLHPNHLHVMHFDEDELSVQTRSERFDPAYYDTLATDPHVVAVGECGIDLYRLPESLDRAEVLDAQKEQFRLQIAFADKHGLPLIIHCRDAHNEVLAILREMVATGGVKRRGVVHSFTGTWKEAEQYVAIGFSIGFNGIITFPPRKAAPEAHEALLEAVRNVPLDRLLIETDAPYLTPIPKRGERNHPAHVRYVAERVAQLRGLPVEVVAQQTTENAARLFLSSRPL
ncbi:TatD family hydrolase [Patescibacteria group bacterium]|nr:TatD family hydrolase [Patescibacteria group bacterium]